jgi:hypothetical protein
VRSNVGPLIPPKPLEPIRRQLGVAYRVLDVLVTHPGLDRSSIVASIRQGVAACVPEHVRVDRKRHTGAFAQPYHKGVEAFRCDRSTSFPAEQVRAQWLLSLQPAQRAQFVALDRMDARRAALTPADYPGYFSPMAIHACAAIIP